MSAHTFTIEPHPTCKGKVLAVTPKPDNHWRCLTDTEMCFYAIGGVHWRGYQKEGAVAYSLSPAQARDLDLILRAGYLSSAAPWNGRVEIEDMLFWHPDAPDDDLTRAEVLALILPPPRCPRTLEMAF